MSLARRAGLVVVAALLWNLTCFPNQDHNVILLVPALWVLVWPEFEVVQRACHMRERDADRVPAVD